MKEPTAEEIVTEIVTEIKEIEKKYNKLFNFCKKYKINKDIEKLIKNSTKDKQNFIEKHINVKINCFTDRFQKLFLFFTMIPVTLTLIITTSSTNYPIILVALHIFLAFILIICTGGAYVFLTKESAYEKILLALENHRFKETMEKNKQ